MNSGWRIERLGDVCDVLDNKRKPITKKDRVAGEYPYYGATGILDYVAGYIFDEPLVLIGEDGAKWGSGDNSAFSASGKYWVNNHAHVIRPHRKKVTDAWLIYYLNATDLSNHISGMTVPKLNQEKMRDIAIPLPPLPEQERIVATLDEAFAGIATATENAKKNLQNARELFESHLQSIFTTKGDGWVEKKFGKVCRFVRGPFGGSLKKSCFKAEGYAVYEQQHAIYDQFNEIRYFIDEEKFNEMKRFELKSGDLIMSCSGTMGKVAIVPEGIQKGIINQALLKLSPNKDLLVQFLRFWMRSQNFQVQNEKHSMGAAIKNVASVGVLKEIDVPMPPLSEQQRLVAQLDTLATETKRLEAIYQQKLDNLAALKQSILQKAFAGELTAKTTAEIIPFPQKIPSIGVTELHAGIIAIAYQKHKSNSQNEQNFGYVKAEKIVHLAEAWAGIDLERTPLQMPYGPADITACEAAEVWAKTNNCFTFDKRTTPYQLNKGSNIGGLIEKIQTALGRELAEKLDRLIQFTLPMGKIEVEVLATLFAAWNNRLLNNKSTADAEIILDARDNWHPDKLAIKRSEFSTMLKWMKQNDFVPEGRGKLVKKGTLI